MVMYIRRINVFVVPRLDSVREQLRPYYSEIGRPSVDPELMIRMLIVGYCYGLRSERRLAQEVELATGLVAISAGPVAHERAALFWAVGAEVRQ